MLLRLLYGMCAASLVFMFAYLLANCIEGAPIDPLWKLVVGMVIGVPSIITVTKQLIKHVSWSHTFMLFFVTVLFWPVIVVIGHWIRENIVRIIPSAWFEPAYE